MKFTWRWIQRGDLSSSTFSLPTAWLVRSQTWSLKLVSHLEIWNWKMNALKCTDSNACLTGCHLHNWGFRGDTKWSPKWDFNPPHLRGFITSTFGDLREVGFLDPVGGAQLFFHFAFRCLRGVCCLKRNTSHPKNLRSKILTIVSRRLISLRFIPGWTCARRLETFWGCQRRMRRASSSLSWQSRDTSSSGTASASSRTLWFPESHVSSI